MTMPFTKGLNFKLVLPHLIFFSVTVKGNLNTAPQVDKFLSKDCFPVLMLSSDVDPLESRDGVSRPAPVQL